MAIDTAAKRASAMLLGMPFRQILPPPDGTIDDSDRATVAYLYSGIDYDGSGPAPGTAAEWLITARRRGSR